MAPIKNLFDSKATKNITQKPPRLSIENLQRTISDVSLELTKETTNNLNSTNYLPPLSETEDAKCECCGMSEECTHGYVSNVRGKFYGKLICGLCAEAVEEEVVKNGGKREEALNEHMNDCLRFNKIERSHPVLLQAEAMREILKKSSRLDLASRVMSLSPRDFNKGNGNDFSISRSLSCSLAIMKDIGGRKTETC